MQLFALTRDFRFGAMGKSIIPLWKAAAGGFVRPGRQCTMDGLAKPGARIAEVAVNMKRRELSGVLLEEYWLARAFRGYQGLRTGRSIATRFPPCTGHTPSYRRERVPRLWAAWASAPG